MNSNPNRPPLYYGCHREAGHYLFTTGMRRFNARYGDPLDRLGRFDGLLPPMDSDDPYIATVSRLPGLGYSVLSFWDYSVDKRANSNSNIFVPALMLVDAAVLSCANVLFPEVFQRLPTAVRLHPSITDVNTALRTLQDTYANIEAGLRGQKSPPTSVPPMIPGDDL